MTISLTPNRHQSKPSTPMGVDVQALSIPPYRPIRILGGHGHTLVAARTAIEVPPRPIVHRLQLADGETVVLHENQPENVPERGNVMLVHGLCGCHSAPYMNRFAVRLLRLGIRVYRMDMRGCGAAVDDCGSITHAGRSDDLIAALDFIASRSSPSLPIGAVGVSLGGNQLLRAAGRVGAGLDATPNWWNRVAALLAVAPPIDLQMCSDHMQRWSLRPYNRYFIGRLLSRIPERLRSREDFQLAVAQNIPKTLREFDRRFTAPLSGFEDERDYYHQSSAMHHLRCIDRPTVIVAATDDPLIPVAMFSTRASNLGKATRLVIQPTGGHVGFLQRRRTVWTDQMVETLFEQMV